MNWFDIAVIGVVALSTLLATFRGFIKEILSLIGWVGAAVVTFVTLDKVRPYARQVVQSETVADIGAGVLIFLAVLVVWAFLSGFVTRRLRGGALGFVDGFFGLVYGAARGALLVAIAYVLLQLAYKENNMPPWVGAAITKPYLETGAAWLRRVSPEEWFERGRKAIEDVQRSGEPARPGPPPTSPQPAQPETPPQPAQPGTPGQPTQPERR